MNDTKAIAGSHLPYKWMAHFYENPNMGEGGFADADMHPKNPHHHPGSSEVAIH